MADQKERPEQRVIDHHPLRKKPPFPGKPDKREPPPITKEVYRNILRAKP